MKQHLLPSHDQATWRPEASLPAPPSMQRMPRLLTALLCAAFACMGLACCTGLTGCTGGPEAVDVPPINPEEAARGALAEYDTNGDGLLSMEELGACPGIRKAQARYDKDGDRRISQQELAQRFAMWAGGGVGVTTLACQVTLNGKPLAGAEVQLIPETFLAGTVQPATGTTDQSGATILAIDTTYLPDDMKHLRGVVHQGVFRLEITHPQMEIPAKYNSQTTLGQEVSADTGENVLWLKLTGK